MGCVVVKPLSKGVIETGASCGHEGDLQGRDVGGEGGPPRCGPPSGPGAGKEATVFRGQVKKVNQGRREQCMMDSGEKGVV